MIIMSLITHPHVVPKTFVHESTIILMHAYLCLQTRLSAFGFYIWYCRECVSKTDMKEKKFIFLALKLFLQLYKIIVEPSTWTILTMSLLSFWALNVVVALLSMQGQKALGFDQKIFSFVFLRSTKVLRVWNNMRVINYRIFIFGWTIPLIVNKMFCC